MAITQTDKKLSELSELPSGESLTGFKTVGVKDDANGFPKTYTVDLGFVETAAANANTKAALVQAKLDTADSDHAQAATDHTTASSDHSVAATDHTTAATDHTTASSDHSVASSDHTASESAASAETARAAAETGRAEAETVRQGKEAGRQSAETSRASAETGRAAAEQTRQTNETARQTAHNLRQDVLLGIDDAEEFDATKRYAAGTYCLHDYTDPTTQVTKKYLWRFTSIHAAGAWTGNDAVQTSVVKELSGLLSGDNNENVNIALSSSDGLLTVSGIQIQVSFEDGSATQTLTTDSDGKAVINITKEKTYTVTFPAQTGYQAIPAVTHKALQNKRHINETYQKTISGTTVQTVTFAKSGGRSTDAPAWNGTSCNLVLSNGTARTATVADGAATFTDVPQGLTGTITCTKLTGWVTPSAISVNTNLSNSVTATYTKVTASGIYMVRDDGEEFTYETWDASDTCVALHIATSDLAEAGCDYYVKIGDLNKSSLTQKAWQTNLASSWKLLPNVPIWSSSSPYYNGETATAKMISDTATYEETSPAAEQAVSQTFTLRGITAYGFMLTRDQMQPMITNKDYIYSCAALAGVTANYYTNNIWTSSQYNASSSWSWFSGSWGSNSKINSYYVLPAYAI